MMLLTIFQLMVRNVHSLSTSPSMYSRLDQYPTCTFVTIIIIVAAVIITIIIIITITIIIIIITNNIIAGSNTVSIGVTSNTTRVSYIRTQQMCIHYMHDNPSLHSFLYPSVALFIHSLTLIHSLSIIHSFIHSFIHSSVPIQIQNSPRH